MEASTDSTDTQDQEGSTDSQSGATTRHVKLSQLATEAGLAGENPFAAPVEANVILISHPEGLKLGTRWRLDRGEVLEIGRSAGCDISLPKALSVSRRHALLRFVDGVVYLEDLGSTNGTAINDQQIEGRVRLKGGDRFQVGTVHFKFLQESDPEHAYFEAIYHLAMRDGLTDTFNKRKFDDEMEREFLRASRYERPLSLILFDIDLFKRVNDEFGHLCGDHVLKELSAIARRHVRPEQTLARVGGEEFVILSPETDVSGSLKLAEKLRQEIAAQPLVFREWSVPITCSFGVSEKGEEMTAPEQLYEAADRALYVAKDSGRNQVSVADW